MVHEFFAAASVKPWQVVAGGRARAFGMSDRCRRRRTRFGWAKAWFDGVAAHDSGFLSRTSPDRRPQGQSVDQRRGIWVGSRSSELSKPLNCRAKRSASVSSEEREIRINGKAFERLSRAKKGDESFSDVIIRLSAATLEGLQRRGEKEIVTSDGLRLTLSIDQDKCLGAMSCVTLAPSVFAYDVSEQGAWRKRAEPLGMKDVEEGEVDSDSLSRAAQSCPYQAITVKDTETGEILFP